MGDLTSTQEQVLNLLRVSTRKRTTKGWIMGATCPKCGKSDKFGIKLNEDRSGEYKNHITGHCFHGHCEFSGSEKTLFRALGREDLISEYEYREDLGTLSRLQLKTKKEEEYIPLKKRHSPLGWRRLYSDDYLESRGFSKGCFERYKVGRTKIDTKLKDYLIFLVLEDEINKGYIARIDWETKRFIAENEKRKSDGISLLPKYKNEGGIEFSEVLYGYDEVVEDTHTIILVEGILDKTNVDRELELYKWNEIKCLCTFGKKISSIQIQKLKNKKIESVILMYDPDAIESIKQYSYNLMMEIENVGVGKLIGEKDPGDMNREELLLILKNLESVLSYGIENIKKLKIN